MAHSYHHRAVLDYCRRLNVALEPFVEVNYNAMLHSSRAFGGEPQRFRHVQADFEGHITELLGKADAEKNRLDQSLSAEDAEKLLAALKDWGALDKDYRYTKSVTSSLRRGFDVDPGGGLMPVAQPSTPLDPQELINSGSVFATSKPICKDTPPSSLPR